MVRHAGSVSVATLISRVLGYVRDALVAAAFGGGHFTDAFYAAFRLPNLFRRILGEGPLTSAFVPVFTEHLVKHEEKDARVFFQTLFTTLFVALSVLVVLGVIFAPALTHAVALGFKADPEKFDLTVKLTRLMFPFLLFVCLAAIAAGALNALGTFFLPGLAPAMLSVAEIVFIFFFIGLWDKPLEGLAVSAVVGGLLHFGILLPALKRKGYAPKWVWNPRHPGVMKVGAAIIPAVWGLSLDQINAFLDTICASFLIEGSVTALYNSNRLMQFPLALFGIATSIAALPTMSLYAVRGDHQSMKDTLNLALRVMLYMMLPATAGLIALGLPIVQVLFEHGRFTPEASRLTYHALAAYCLGLPAFAGVKIVVSAFYSMKDTRTPVRVATYCLLINMVGNLTLMWRFGVGGLALATTLASCANAGILLYLFRRKLGLLGGRLLLKSFVQSAVVSLLMAGLSWSLLHWTAGSLYWRVPVAVAAGALLYAAVTWILGMEEQKHILRMFLKKKPAA